MLALAGFRPGLRAGEGSPGTLEIAAGGERRCDESRADGVDANAVRRKLHRRAFRHADHGRFSGGVNERAGVAAQTGDGGGVDDDALGAAAPKAPGRVLDPEKHALGEHVEGVVPVLRGRLGERADGAADAGVVEHDVEPAELALREIQHRLDVGLLRNVGFDEPHLVGMPGRGGELERLRAGFRIEIGDDHARAFAQEGQYRGASHAAGAAGNDGDFRRQTTVRVILAQVILAHVSSHDPP